MLTFETNQVQGVNNILEKLNVRTPYSSLKLFHFLLGKLGEVTRLYVMLK